MGQGTEAMGWTEEVAAHELGRGKGETSVETHPFTEFGGTRSVCRE